MEIKLSIVFSTGLVLIVTLRWVGSVSDLIGHEKIYVHGSARNRPNLFRVKGEGLVTRNQTPLVTGGPWLTRKFRVDGWVAETRLSPSIHFNHQSDPLTRAVHLIQTGTSTADLVTQRILIGLKGG